MDNTDRIKKSKLYVRITEELTHEFFLSEKQYIWLYGYLCKTDNENIVRRVDKIIRTKDEWTKVWSEKNLLRYMRNVVATRYYYD